MMNLIKMNKTLIFLTVIFAVYCVKYNLAIRWLAVQNANVLQWSDEIVVKKNARNLLNSPKNNSPCNILRKKFGFSKLQAKICRTTVDLIPYIKKASTLASNTCQSVFASRRWNCSSIRSAPLLTPDLTRANREQAYVHAMSSAALTYVMAQLCTSGFSHHCSCANHPKDPPNGNFKWGGCGDNIKWGIRFSRRFIDSAEKYNYKSSNQIAEKSKHSQQSIKQLSFLNLHNNRVGRRVVSESLTTQCKCHGVSGSCSIKTCWKTLPYIIEIGQRLFRRYINAVEISRDFEDLNKTNLPEVPGLKSPSYDQLIYFTKSPDYCTKDENLGSMGTTGRKCNITSAGIDGCSQMCCGRGYRMILEERLERCQCKYHYCCYVKCKTCRIFEEVYECT